MSISGDPLDGLARYIEQKSIGLKYVEEFIKELENAGTEEVMIEDEITDEVSVDSSAESDNIAASESEPIEKERKEKPIVQVIGYVDTIKKIQTKK